MIFSIITIEMYDWNLRMVLAIISLVEQATII